MELSQLKYFCEAAKEQHITNAAKKLNVAQPAVTLSIHKLEEELSVKLFTKSGRGVELTECGKYLYERASAILDSLNTIPNDLERISQVESKTIRINLLAASTITTDIIIEYKKIYNDIQFKISQNSDEKYCDIIVTTDVVSPVEKSGSVCSFAEDVFIVLPKDSPFAEQGSVRLSDLSDQGFISLAGSKQFRTLCDNFCKKAGFSARTVFESDNPYAVKNIIATGTGIGFWPEYSWGKVSGDDVKLVRISEPTCSRYITVSRTDTRTSDAADHFFSYLTHRISEIKSLAINHHHLH